MRCACSAVLQQYKEPLRVAGRAFGIRLFVVATEFQPERTVYALQVCVLHSGMDVTTLYWQEGLIRWASGQHKTHSKPAIVSNLDTQKEHGARDLCSTPANDTLHTLTALR